MNIDAQVIALRIKKLRHKRNMTQEDLAEVANLSTVFISHIENGKRMPSIDKMVEICNALGCTMDEIFDGYLTAKPSSVQPRLEVIIADCTSPERRFLLKMCEAFHEYLKDSI